MAIFVALLVLGPRAVVALFRTKEGGNHMQLAARGTIAKDLLFVTLAAIPTFYRWLLGNGKQDLVNPLLHRCNGLLMILVLWWMDQIEWERLWLRLRQEKQWWKMEAKTNEAFTGNKNSNRSRSWPTSQIFTSTLILPSFRRHPMWQKKPRNNTQLANTKHNDEQTDLSARSSGTLSSLVPYIIY